MSLIKIYTYFLLVLPAMIAFVAQKGENRRKIIMDLERLETVEASKSSSPVLWRLYKAWQQQKRSVRYFICV